MWAAYRRSGSLTDRNRLVEHYYDMVDMLICSKYGRRLSNNDQHLFSTDELYGCGAIGLVKGIETYNPKAGLKPELWLNKKIAWALIDGIAAYDVLCASDRKSVKRGEMGEPKAAHPLMFSQVEKSLGTGREVIGGCTKSEVGEDWGSALRSTFAGWNEREVRALLMLHVEGGTLGWASGAYAGWEDGPARYASGSVKRLLQRIA